MLILIIVVGLVGVVILKIINNYGSTINYKYMVLKSETKRYIISMRKMKDWNNILNNINILLNNLQNPTLLYIIRKNNIIYNIYNILYRLLISIKEIIILIFMKKVDKYKRYKKWYDKNFIIRILLKILKIIKI